MGMHPKFDYDDIFLLSDLIFSDNKEAVLRHMQMLNLIDERSIGNWMSLLPNPVGNDQRFLKLLDKLKLSVDPHVANYGHISISSPWGIVNNAINAARFFQIEHFLRFDNIRNLTALDFGSGVYRPLSVAIIMFVNGFKEVVAFEPFPPKADFPWLACLETANQIMQYPEKYNFSGINTASMLSNLARLDFSHIREKFIKLSQGETKAVDMGGIRMVNDITLIPEGGSDFQFSNAVLEHVPQLQEVMRVLWSKLSPNGVALHIFDFLDHRYYDDNSLHPYQKYYDGILDEINGLLPTEVETAFVTAGFNGAKVTAQTVPDHYFTGERQITGKYKNVPMSELQQHINMYYLTKAGSV